MKLGWIVILVLALIIGGLLFALSFDGGCPYGDWLHDTLRGCKP